MGSSSSPTRMISMKDFSFSGLASLAPALGSRGDEGDAAPPPARPDDEADDDADEAADEAAAEVVDDAADEAAAAFAGVDDEAVVWVSAAASAPAAFAATAAPALAESPTKTLAE